MYSLLIKGNTPQELNANLLAVAAAIATQPPSNSIPPTGTLTPTAANPATVTTAPMTASPSNPNVNNLRRGRNLYNYLIETL
jgi:hypothetical protein